MNPPEGTKFKVSDRNWVYAVVPSSYPYRPAAVWAVIESVFVILCVLAFFTPVWWIFIFFALPALIAGGIAMHEYNKTRPTVYKIGNAWEAYKLIPLINGPMRHIAREMLWDIAMERENHRLAGTLNVADEDDADAWRSNIALLLEDHEAKKTNAEERRSYYQSMIEGHKEAEELGP